MRYLLVVAAALSTLALSACDRPAAVAPPPTPVIVQVPGPAGPPGAPGAEGAKGEQGKQGGGTIVVVPAPETKP